MREEMTVSELIAMIAYFGSIFGIVYLVPYMLGAV